MIKKGNEKMLLVGEESGEFFGYYSGKKNTKDNKSYFLNNTDKINEKAIYTKVFPNEIIKIVKSKLSSVEMNVLLICISNFSYYSGAIKYKQSDKFLTPVDFEKIIGSSKRSILYAIDKLCLLGIIHKGKTGKQFQLYGNPYIFMKGERVNKTLVDMFKDYKKIEDRYVEEECEEIK